MKKSTKKSVESKTTPEDALNDPQKRPSQSGRKTAAPKSIETPNPAALEQPSAQNAELPVNSDVQTPTTSPETQSPDSRAIADWRSLVLRLGPSWFEEQREPNQLLAEVPQPLSKNQAAFLLGFYIQRPAPDDAIDPLMIVGAGGIPVSKLILLDNSVSRLSAYDDELFSFCESHNSTDLKPEYRDSPILKKRFWDVITMRSTEIIKLRKIAETLWSGRSERRDWYYVGVAMGRLLVKVAPDESPFAKLIATEEELTDAVLGSIRTASKWRRDDRFRADLCIEVQSLKEKLRVECDTIYTRRDLIKVFSTLITDVEGAHPSAADILKAERDQFIYQGFHDGKFGMDLLELVNKERDSRAWPHIRHPDNLREIAEKFAHDHNLDPPPSRPPGCPSA